MATITVPTTESGVDGFIKNIVDEAFAAENQIIFEGDHTAAARILCETAPSALWRPGAGAISVWANGDDLCIGGALGETRRRRGRKFVKTLKDELESGKRVKFIGGRALHTEIVKAFKGGLIRRHITGVFISMMESGELPPWKQPWRLARPYSFASGKPYRGINAYHLAYKAAMGGWRSPRWITRRKAEQKEHPVRNGERGAVIIMAKPNEEGEARNGPNGSAPPPPVSYFYHTVFNLNQCEGMERAGEKAALLPKARSVIREYVDRERRLIPATLKFAERGTSAYYRPSEDRIVIPPRSMFADEAEYCVTAFHEIAHSTGHPNRLDRRDRNKPAPFGSHEYGQEELAAEMTASLLSAETDLDFSGAWARNAASYLDSWLSVIRGDPDMLIRASYQATAAVEYILNREGAREEARERADRRARARRERERKAGARGGKRG